MSEFPMADERNSREPEATALAAETIRGRMEQLRRGAHPESANQQLHDIASDLLRERDALLEENERLRYDLGASQENSRRSRDGETYWKDAAQKALSDLDRQHALASEGSRQRDALADALQRYTDSDDFCRCEGEDPSCACCLGEAALRLAGRLPEES